MCRNTATNRPDHREHIPGRASALQQALMKFADRTTYYIINPAVGTEFDDLQKAYEYYNLYSWECGFGIRKGKKRYSNNCVNRKLLDDERYQLGQDFNCSCGVSATIGSSRNIDLVYVRNENKQNLLNLL